MTDLVMEDLGYGEPPRVTSIVLDDGTELYNYETRLQVDDGTPFLLEILPDPYGPETTEYDALGDKEIVEVSPKAIQGWYDEGRLTVIKE